MEVDSSDQSHKGILPWQLFYIDRHSYELENVTKITPELLKDLVQYGVITEAQSYHLLYGGHVAELVYGRNNPTLYDMDFFRPLPSAELDYSPFECLQKALQIAELLEAAGILNKGTLLSGDYFEVNAKEDFNFENLSESISCGKLEILQKGISKLGDSAKKLEGHNDMNLLHVAVGCGQIDIIHYLVSVGFKLTDKDFEGNTPVHYIGKWSTNIVQVTKALLQFNCDLLQLNESSLSIAHMLPKYLSDPRIYDEWTQLLFQSGHGGIFTHLDEDERSPLHCALKRLDLLENTIKLIFSQAGVDPNRADADDQTLMHLAVLAGRSMKVLEVIINNGADPRKKDHLGNSTLHFAVAGGNIDAIKYFLELGGNVNERDRDGETPFHTVSAAPCHNIEITKILLQHGADAFAVDKCGNTAAHRWSSVLDLFIQKKGKAQNYKAWTQFMTDSGYGKILQMKNENGELPPDPDVVRSGPASDLESEDDAASGITDGFGRLLSKRKRSCFRFHSCLRVEKNL